MARRKKGKRKFGVFTKEEENSLLLFTAGLDFGLALVGMAYGLKRFAIAVLVLILLVLLYVDYRIKEE